MMQYSTSFIEKLKTIIPNFPSSKSGLGRSNRKVSEFWTIIHEFGYHHLTSFNPFDAYWLISHDLFDFPKCRSNLCSNTIGRKAPGSYCCMACYKADPAANEMLSAIKLKLYSDQNWKEKTNNKRVETCQDRYGRDHPMQNPEVFAKHEKSSYQAKNHLGMTGLRGYEPIVLDYFVNELNFRPNKDIVNGTDALSVYDWTLIDDGGKHQLPDLYLPAYATFVEVKSDYTLEKDFDKISKLPPLLENLGVEYLVILVSDNKLYEVNLTTNTKTELNLKRIKRNDQESVLHPS